MPYIYDPNLDPERQNQQLAQGVQLSGAAPVANTLGSTSANQPGARGVNTGSGFQNLDKYLSTNQSKEFGGQVLGRVGEQVQGASNQMTSAADQFKQQVGSSNMIPTSEQINQAIANPTTADAKQFETWRTQDYKGPKNLAESQDVWNRYWSAAKQAQTSANLLGTEPGRFTLLDQYFGKPTYGFGQKSLDNLLIQQSGLGKEARDLQNQATELQTLGTNRANELQDIASQRAGDVEKARNEALSAIGIDKSGNVLTGEKAGALGQSYQNFEDYLAAQNAARDAAQATFKANLAKDIFSPADLEAMGLSNVGGTNLYDLDLANYATYGGDLTKNQVMTPEQRARIQALSNLAGITDTYASGFSEDPGKNYSFDFNRLKSDVAAREAQYQQALRDTPISVGTNSGQTFTRPLSEVEQDIAATYADIARGNDTSAGRAFLKFAEPAVAQMKQQLADQYRANRILNTERMGIPTNTRPPISIG